jgi:hypothetical protein
MHIFPNVFFESLLNSLTLTFILLGICSGTNNIYVFFVCSDVSSVSNRMANTIFFQTVTCSPFLKKLLHFLCNRRFLTVFTRARIRRYLGLDESSSQPQSYFFKIYFNVIFPSSRRTPKLAFIVSFSYCDGCGICYATASKVHVTSLRQMWVLLING